MGPITQVKLATMSAPDTRSEDRWPDWATAAKQAGAHSSLSIGLPVQEKVTGALNIYATEQHAVAGREAITRRCSTHPRPCAPSQGSGTT